MASFEARRARGERGGALAAGGAPLLPLGLGASLLFGHVVSGGPGDVWAPFAAALLAFSVASRAAARALYGRPFGGKGLALTLPAPTLVAASYPFDAPRGAILVALVAVPLFALANVLEGLEGRPRWRGRARGALGLATAVALAGFWAHFWTADLGHARVRVALAPAQAPATAGAGFALFSPGARPASAGRMALGGGAFGLSVTFALLAARADAVGCVGVSSAYEAALLATAILLFGVGPLAPDVA